MLSLIGANAGERNATVVCLLLLLVGKLGLRTVWCSGNYKTLFSCEGASILPGKREHDLESLGSLGRKRIGSPTMTAGHRMALREIVGRGRQLQ